jgi:hypothetical protein
MTVREAISMAKKEYNWSVVANEPTSVEIWFISKSHPNSVKPDSTQLDLYEKDKEKELEELWKSLANEFESDENSVLAVEVFGTII